MMKLAHLPYPQSQVPMDFRYCLTLKVSEPLTDHMQLVYLEE